MPSIDGITVVRTPTIRPLEPIAEVQYRNGIGYKKINGSVEIMPNSISPNLLSTTLGTSYLTDEAVTEDKLADDAVTAAKVASSAYAKVIATESWLTTSDRTISTNAQTRWPGAAARSITTSGGRLEVTVIARGLTLSAGTAYIGFELGGNTYECGGTTNYATISEMVGRKFIQLSAGTYNLYPCGRSNGAGGFTWKAFNEIWIDIVEHPLMV